jgi:hypothetical protein
MLKRHITLTILVAALGGAPRVFGQEATEMYIPIGQSPGVSNKTSLLGTIQAVDLKNRTLTVSSSKGARTVKITKRTHIWIDQSQKKQPNRACAPSELKPGRKVEVNLGKNNPTSVAKWIKVQL